MTDDNRVLVEDVAGEKHKACPLPLCLPKTSYGQLKGWKLAATDLSFYMTVLHENYLFGEV
jgi:hypothetical protein